MAAAGVLAAIGRTEQIQLATAALLICGAMGLLTFGLCWLLESFTPGGVAYGFTAGTLLRLIGCSVAVFLSWRLDVDASFGYWMAGAYMALLVVEVAIIARYVASLQLPGVRPASTLENRG